MWNIYERPLKHVCLLSLTYFSMTLLVSVPYPVTTFSLRCISGAMTGCARGWGSHRSGGIDWPETQEYVYFDTPCALTASSYLGTVLHKYAQYRWHISACHLVFWFPATNFLCELRQISMFRSKLNCVCTPVRIREPKANASTAEDRWRPIPEDQSKLSKKTIISLSTQNALHYCPSRSWRWHVGSR